MKYALLLFLAAASSQLFSMNRLEEGPANVSLDTLIQLYRDKNLTHKRVKAFFEKPANRYTIEEFMRSAEAQFIKAQGELYTRTNNSNIEFYEIENGYAGLILLALCTATKEDQLTLFLKAQSLIENFERLKQ